MFFIWEHNLKILRKCLQSLFSSVHFSLPLPVPACSPSDAQTYFFCVIPDRVLRKRETIYCLHIKWTGVSEIFNSWLHYYRWISLINYLAGSGSSGLSNGFNWCLIDGQVHSGMWWIVENTVSMKLSVAFVLSRVLRINNEESWSKSTFEMVTSFTCILGTVIALWINILDET